MTIRSYFDRAAAQAPEHIAVQYREDNHVRSRSYGEMALRISTVAELAGHLGLVPRQSMVALILENSPEWMEIYLAHSGCGFTVVPIDPKLRSTEVAFMLQDAGVVAVYTDTRHLPLLQEIAAELPLLRHIVIVDNGREAGADLTCGQIPCIAFSKQVAALATAAAGPASFYQRHVARDEDIASIIYTSGTTGVPKGAMLTHANFCADAEGALQLITVITTSDRFMIVLPLFHSFSFTANFIVPLCVGARMQFVSNLRNVGEDLKLFSPTILMAVPLLVDKMYAKIESGIRHNFLARLLIMLGLRSVIALGVRRNLGGALRLIVVGGAPCSKKVLIGMRKFGLPIIEGYGLTESSGVVSANPYAGLNKSGTIGQPVPGTVVKLVDKEDPSKAVPEGEPGELVFSGPQVMKGYWNLPQADEEVFIDGFLRTGDVAVIDEDGYIKIVDRLKDMIAVGGFKVFPSQVEEVLYKHEAVKEALVIGVPDDYRGESPKAFVALEEGMVVDSAALKDWLNVQLGKHERVVDVVVRDSLPKTMIGKLDRKALRAEELG